MAKTPKKNHRKGRGGGPRPPRRNAGNTPALDGPDGFGQHPHAGPAPVSPRDFTTRETEIILPEGEPLLAGQSQLPPPLRGLPPDSEVPVMIVTGDMPPPEGAGAYLGTTIRAMALSSGGEIPPGARIYQRADGQAYGHGLQQVSPGTAAGEQSVRQLGRLSPAAIDGEAELRMARRAAAVGAKLPAQDIPAAFRKPFRLEEKLVSPANEAVGDRDNPAIAGTGLDREILRQAAARNPALAGLIAQRDRPDAGHGEEVPAALLPSGDDQDYVTGPTVAAVRRAEREIIAPDVLNQEDAWREIAAQDARQRGVPLVFGSGDEAIEFLKRHDGTRASLRTSWTAAEVLDQHARVAERWRKPSQQLTDYAGWFMQSVRRAAGPRTAGMFWPAEPDEEDGSVTVGDSRKLCGLIAHGLMTAETYQITPEMSRRLRDAMMVMAPGLDRLDERELPGPAGFVWLDQPWDVKDMRGFPMPIRALSWERCTVHSDKFYGCTERDRQLPTRILPAVRLVMWTLQADDAAVNPWDFIDEGALEFDRERLGELRMIHTEVVPFARPVLRVEAGEDGQPAAAMASVIRIVWTFLGMLIAKSSSRAEITAVTPPRADRRRMPKSLDHTQVHVITLRKYQVISDDPGGHRDVGWSCRWTVKGFYRHIDKYEDFDESGSRRTHQVVVMSRPGDDYDLCEVCYARGDEIRVTFVHAHNRGPSWLPLRTAAEARTLHRLSR